MRSRLFLVFIVTEYFGGGGSKEGHPIYTVGGYGAKQRYSDPVIWINLALNCELYTAPRQPTDLSPDTVTAPQRVSLRSFLSKQLQHKHE